MGNDISDINNVAFWERDSILITYTLYFIQEGKMAKYSVAFQVFATTYIDVEADSEDEAREKAEAEIDEPTLCDRCSDDVEIESIGNIVSVKEGKTK
jgi:hypothetical protein